MKVSVFAARGHLRCAVLCTIAAAGLAACNDEQSFGASASSSSASGIVARAPGAAPMMISGSPQTSVAAGNSYSFQPTAKASAAGGSLKFSVLGKPLWALFDAASGRLSGTPTSAQLGRTDNILISVTDGQLSASLPPFSITVTAATDQAPTISGKPAGSVNAGSSYSFTPVATGGDGSTLTFTIENKPSWANFNSATGALTGTPTAANAGTFSDIVVTVSDGTQSATLPAFAITVNQAASGTVTVDWTPPTQNSDGTTLANLAGYRIHYGNTADSLSQTIDVSNPGLTAYTINSLGSGTWYFGVTAYSATGAESAMSGVISTTL